MTARKRSTANPADLLLRISRTPTGLHITSPQLPGWAARVRGPVPIAQAVDAALVQIELDRYARRRGQPSDLAAWDIACESLAAAGAQLTTNDVVIVRNGAAAARRGGQPAQQRALARLTTSDRPITGKFVPQHDPFAWTDLGNGQWRSPGGAIYGEQTRQVQGVMARRAEITAAKDADGQQQSFDDVAS